MKIQQNFYLQSAETLAPLLLGKLLCRKLDSGEILRLRITETEAYVGEYDTACHAHRGKTPRNSVMYEQGGVAYIYLCYGIHNLLNVVSGEADAPEAVLIRGVKGFNGPGKLTKAMQIDRTLNGKDLTTSDELWLEDDGTQFEYTTTPRIGIDYASEEDRTRLWRFVSKI
ncbi:MAG: DNA-3-methyladenine glycosylase [Oscillospiraceae bacterium]|nr:DNA-3-methyladenine glycosylase [Oscillospiraceae bacterium]